MATVATLAAVDDAPAVVELPAASGWRVAAASRRGTQRIANEDRWLVVPAAGHRPLLLAVADGVGGEAAGERASAAALEALAAGWRRWRGSTGVRLGVGRARRADPQRIGGKLLACARRADRAVRSLVQREPAARGAATTLTAAAVSRDFAVLAHAGDSRAYLVGGGVARQLTADHTWVAEQVAQHRLAPSQTRRHPMRSVITRYLGQSVPCEFDAGVTPRAPGDWLLLCTDGVSNVVDDAELLPPAAGDAGDAVRRILDAVVRRGGGDDATVIVCGPAAEAAAASLSSGLRVARSGGSDPFGLRQAFDRRRAPRRALIAAGLGAAAAGAAGTVAGGRWLAPRAADLVAAAPWLRYGPPPVAAAEAYLAAWQAGQHDALYDRLTHEAQRTITREAFVRRHEAVAAEMTLTALAAAVLPDGAPARVGTGEALVGFEAVYTTARFGELRRRNELRLVWEQGRWRVAWQPATMLPELTGGRLVRAFSDSPARGAILDRYGRPLALQPPGSAMVRVAGDPPAPEGPPGAAGRVYPEGPVAGPTVGYTGEATADDLKTLAPRGYLAGDLLGQAGVEAAAEALLAGQRGGRLTVIAPSGEVAATLSSVPARPGETVVLTLDLDLQRQAEAALGERPGAVVVVDAASGAIQALASFPRYDPNVFASGQGVAAVLNDSGQPLLNRPAQGLYAPGSIFKAVTMAAALESGAFQPQSEFTCTGRWTGLPGLRLDCWLATGHGHLDLVSGLTQSCNSVFYEVGKRLDELDSAFLPGFAARSGFGRATGAVPGGEPPGTVPGPAWKPQALRQPWTRGDAVNLAIGQGDLLVTPLQVAGVYTGIASGGQTGGLFLLERALLPGGSVERLLGVQNRAPLPWSPATFAAVRAGLHGVVGAPQGTAAFVFQGSPLAPVVAGKTGTAETAPGRAPHAWFAAYAPAGAPNVVVLVMLEHGGEGSRAAAPIARRLLEGLLG